MQIPEIKIGIQTEKEIRFRLNGTFINEQNRHFPKGTYTARIRNNEILLETGAQEMIYGELHLKPENIDTDHFALMNVAIGIGFHWDKKEEQLFSGSFNLIRSGEKITAINILHVEEYLTSVISSEMNANASSALLKAHAVISRSWVLAQIEKRKALRLIKNKMQSTFISEHEMIRWHDREDHTRFDVCADDHCQRYQGITRASASAAREAVTETRGEVLSYNGKLCDTRFSKCCGGITELFENTWEPVNHPYLQRVYDCANEQPAENFDLTDEETANSWIMSTPEAFCRKADQKVLVQVLNDYDLVTHDFYRWEVVYTAKELGGLIKARTGIDFGVILDLVPLQRGVSGRIIKLKIIGSIKTMVIGKELEIRRTLSKSHLYSSAFVVEKTGDKDNPRFILHGAGWGHGVGLCQIGAAVMGAEGYSYHDILLHYYRGAKVERRY